MRHIALIISLLIVAAITNAQSSPTPVMCGNGLPCGPVPWSIYQPPTLNSPTPYQSTATPTSAAQQAIPNPLHAWTFRDNDLLVDEIHSTNCTYTAVKNGTFAFGMNDWAQVGAPTQYEEFAQEALISGSAGTGIEQQVTGNWADYVLGVPLTLTQMERGRAYVYTYSVDVIQGGVQQTNDLGTNMIDDDAGTAGNQVTHTSSAIHEEYFVYDGSPPPTIKFLGTDPVNEWTLDDVSLYACGRWYGTPDDGTRISKTFGDGEWTIPDTDFITVIEDETIAPMNFGSFSIASYLIPSTGCNIINKTGEYSVTTNAGGSIVVEVTTSGTSARVETEAITGGEKMLHVVYDDTSGEIDVYLGGEELNYLTATTGTGSRVNTSGDLTIGGGCQITYDELYIHDTALNANQVYSISRVLALYSSIFTPTPLPGFNATSTPNPVLGLDDPINTMEALIRATDITVPVRGGTPAGIKDVINEVNLHAQVPFSYMKGMAYYGFGPFGPFVQWLLLAMGFVLIIYVVRTLLPMMVALFNWLLKIIMAIRSLLPF